MTRGNKTSATASAIRDLIREVRGNREETKKTNQLLQRQGRGGGVGGSGGSRGHRPNAASAISQAGLLSKSGAKGAGAAGVAAGAGPMAAAAIKEVVSELISSMNSAQDRGTSVYNKASGLEDRSTVEARARFEEESSRRPELIRGLGRLGSNVPIVGGALQSYANRSAAETEFATRQAVAPALAALQDARGRVGAALDARARATGSTMSDDVVRRLLANQQISSNAAIAQQRAINRIAGQRERELYKLPQFQARALIYGG